MAYLKYTLVIFLSFLNSQIAHSQVDTAYNFTLTDIEGNQHQLYDYLDSCKSVLIEFLAPWCDPCIENHLSGISQEVYKKRGPNSTHNDVVVLYIDTDTNSTITDPWTVDFTTVDFPVIDITPQEHKQLEEHYSAFLGAWPFTIAIYPDRTKELTSLESVTQVISQLIIPKVNAGLDFAPNCYNPNLNASITNIDSSYIEYNWIEILPNGMATPPPFDSKVLNPEINDPGTFMLSAFNNINGKGNSDIVVVEKINKRSPSLSTAQDSIWLKCNGDTTTLEVNGVWGAGIWSRSWESLDGNIIELLDSTGQQIIVQGGGTYSATTFDNSNGCSTTVDIIVIDPSQIAIDSANVLHPNMSAKGSISIFAQGGTGNLSYQWSNGATDSSIYDLLPGTYSCTITDSNGCNISVTYILKNTTSQYDIAGNNNLKITSFPNPVINNLFIVLENNIKRGSVVINDTNGNPVNIIDFNQKEDEPLNIPLHGLESGLYIIQVNSDLERSHPLKIIKL